MADYQDVQIARRAYWLMRGSEMDFSVLNFMVFILLIAVVVVGFSAIFN